MTIYTQSILNAYPYFWIPCWKVIMESYVFGWLSCTWEKIELFLLVILCHEFRVSLYFDLLCHFCMNFVGVAVSWASQSVKIARPYLRQDREYAPRRALVPLSPMLVTQKWSARCALLRSSSEALSLLLLLEFYQSLSTSGLFFESEYIVGIYLKV